MKTRMTTWVILIALGAAVGCSETETGIEPEPGNDGQVSLGITPNLKVEAGSKASTKSVVNGGLITYTDYTTAPGLGVLVTKSDVSGWYEPDATSSGYTGHHVWYIGDDKGANWISITDKKTSYDQKNEVPYYLTKTVGKVYAYYPYDKDAINSLENITSESDLKIPVTVLASGEIDASTNNAEKSWNTSTGTWQSTKSTDRIKHAATGEKDYLYFAGPDRYVNNGRADDQTPFDPEGGPTNNDATNPGYLINLNMEHGLAMVSFRVYDGGHLSDNAVNFIQFQLKNHGEGTKLKTVGGKMSLVDGKISDEATTGTVTRTITNYTLMRQIKEGEQSASAFIEAPSVKGQSVSKSVSALLYPLTFGESEIDAVITLKEGDNAPIEYTVTLPSNTWTAGTNCIYTFSAGRNKLTIMEVTVAEWEDSPQDDIPL